MHYFFTFQAVPSPCPASSILHSLHALHASAGLSASVSGPTLEHVCVATASISKLIVPVSAISMAQHRPVLYWQKVRLQQHLRWQCSSPTQNFPSTVSSVLEDCIKYWRVFQEMMEAMKNLNIFPSFLSSPTFCLRWLLLLFSNKLKPWATFFKVLQKHWVLCCFYTSSLTWQPRV